MHRTVYIYFAEVTFLLSNFSENIDTEDGTGRPTKNSSKTPLVGSLFFNVEIELYFDQLEQLSHYNGRAVEE